MYGNVVYYLETLPKNIFFFIQGLKRNSNVACRRIIIWAMSFQNGVEYVFMDEKVSRCFRIVGIIKQTNPNTSNSAVKPNFQ